MSDQDTFEVESYKRKSEQVAPIETNIILSQKDADAAIAHRTILVNYVKSQLIEGKDGDFWEIPGTKKKSLLKPGAEKLLKLFRLGVKIDTVKDLTVIDIPGNYAQFACRARVYHIQSGTVLAEVDRIASSHEDKFRVRTVKKKNENGVEVYTKEETPVAANLNNLLAMTQKRAMVAATILAVAASDFFTQDMEDVEGNREHKFSNNDSGNPGCPSCGKKMMISKYFDEKKFKVAPYYCVKCKTNLSRDLGEETAKSRPEAAVVITSENIPF